MPAVIDPLHWPLRKHLLWLLPALLIKGVFFLYFINDTAALEHMGRWALYTSDTVGYVGPGENLYTYGRYEDDHRMPGFAMLFYFLRHFLSTGNAADAITVLQWLFSCVGMYALALTVLMLGAPWRWFLFTYAALISSLLVARLEVDLMTDSFCTSALALHASFLIFHLRGGNRWWLPIAGLMLTWAVFLRPIYTQRRRRIRWCAGWPRR